MSYQQHPPADGSPLAPPPPPPPTFATAAPPAAPPAAPSYMPSNPAPYARPSAPLAADGRRGTGWKFGGAVLMVAGLLAGGVLLYLSGMSSEETVKKFARAPVGCTTTLEFSDTGTFTLYLETRGTVAEVDGDCDNDGRPYERSDDDPPQVTLTLVDADGAEVRLRAADGPSYSAGAYDGTALHTVEIDERGSYLLTVTSADDDFAIAVGSDEPEGNESLLLIAGAASMVVGIVVGAVLLLVGRNRGRGSAAPPVVAHPLGQWPQQPTVPGYAPPSSPQVPPAPSAQWPQQPSVPGYTPPEQ